MKDLGGVGLRGAGMAYSCHFLGVYCGLGSSMLWEGLCLDGGVGPTNFGVHLEVDHRSRDWWWGRAAVLHGQECECHCKVRSKVICTMIVTWRGSFVRTHVTVSSKLCVRKARSVVCKVFPRSRGNPVCSIYEYTRPLPGMVVVE